mmetsp:Transcript_66935/g.105937  ORF Transcript_66935/g.105937 Transcript_66935/m.105937 type:complete len:389 (-) Transcript_66935:159-1325(-)
MLTISISESLGPASWSEWVATDTSEAQAWAEAGFSEEAWHQQQHEQMQAPWGYEASLMEDESVLRDIETWRQAEDASSWSLFSGSPAWPTPGLGPHAALEGIVDPQAASLAALNGVAMPSTASHIPNATVTASANKQGPNEAAWASPLRVPLPAPLTAEPLSQFEYELELEPADDTLAEEPQKVSAIPGPSPLLALPPGLLGRPDTTIVAPVAPGPVQRSPPLAIVATHAPQGMSICSAEVDGAPCTRVEWKIDDFSGKLQASMGRPVVSPAFDACGLSNLRLMVFPDARDAVKSARSHERKSLYANMVKKGPLYGSLKLKTDGLELPTVMTFSMLVGNVRAGPHVYDFSEQAVCGLADFGVDWLQQVEKASGALRVSIEIFEVRPKK